MKSEKMKKTAVLGGMIMLLILCAAGVYFAGKNSRTSTQGNLKVEKNTVDWDGELESQNEAGDSAIKIPYYEELNAGNGKKYVGVMLVNPKENECYFKYTWKIAETEEILYTSSLIEPGKAIDGIDMDKALESGEYDIDMQIDTYSMEDKSELNKAVIKTKLIIA